MACILTGKPVADSLLEKTHRDADALIRQGVAPTLAVVRVGENPDDLSYERTLIKRAGDAGVQVRVLALPHDVSQGDLEAELRRVNEDAAIHGCLMFRPLPKHLDEAAACEALDPAKDIDGVTRANLAAVVADDRRGFAPSTAEACLYLLDHYDVALAGSHVAVVGRSLVVGKPLAHLLLACDATVTICHSRTQNLQEICQRADIVICATGKARLFDASYFRVGQTVVDVGMNFDDSGSMCGDVDFESVEPLVDSITPVPRGVGAVTTAVTLKHVVEAARRATK